MMVLLIGRHDMAPRSDVRFADISEGYKRKESLLRPFTGLE